MLTLDRPEQIEITEEALFEERLARFATHGDTALFVPKYLPHYSSLDTAPFHYDLASALDDREKDLIEIIGFRDSAKSTYSTLAFPLRVALTGEYKFIVIINDTTEQVEITMANLKHELEENAYVRRDFPDIRVGHTWSKYNIILSNGTRIIGRSRGQNIRGIRHRQYRPDLIIVDDPENLKQVKKKVNRYNTEAWFNAEVLPAKAAFRAKLIVIGNYLHNDGFIARLSKNALFNVIRLPCIDEHGIPLWLSKYPNQEAVDRKKKEVGATAWNREYMLKAVVAENQPIRETDIQRYENKILSEVDSRGTLTLRVLNSGYGLDLAISEKESADFTTMVGGFQVILNPLTGKRQVLILPSPVNEHLDFDATQKRAVLINKSLPYGSKWYVEDVGYQKAALQNLKKSGLSVFPMRPITDKRARLEAVSPFVKDGTVLFPDTGCEDLIEQIVNFGSEEHDDLVDAFVYLILGLLNKPQVTSGKGRPDKLRSGQRK